MLSTRIYTAEEHGYDGRLPIHFDKNVCAMGPGVPPRPSPGLLPLGLLPHR